MKSLKAITQVDVHFYDIDLMNIVWHGNYIKYLEEAREAFGREHGIAYMDIYNHGYLTPIVDMQLRYKSMVKFEERLLVEISYRPCKSAKLMFDYVIYREADKSVVLEASSTQLFMTREGEFEVSSPEFYRKWQQENL